MRITGLTFAKLFGKYVEWHGPVVFGRGWIWCGKIWFDPRDSKTHISG